MSALDAACTQVNARLKAFAGDPEYSGGAVPLYDGDDGDRAMFVGLPFDREEGRAFYNGIEARVRRLHAEYPDAPLKAILRPIILQTLMVGVFAERQDHGDPS